MENKLESGPIGEFKTSSSQWSILAVVRFFLAFTIVCGHINHFKFASGTDALTNILFTFGDFAGPSAVLGFFLISGFSIASSISRNTKGFYQRRIFRIYPLYAISIIGSIVPFLLLGRSIIDVPNGHFFRSGVLEIIKNLLFLQSFVTLPLSSNNVVWSLSIEVFFYLLAPLFNKTSSDKLIILIGFSSLVFALYPILERILHPQSPLPDFRFLKHGLVVVFTLWTWLLGFLYFRYKSFFWSKIAVIILGCSLIILNHSHDGRFGVFAFFITSVSVVYSSEIKLPQALIKLFDYLGNVSYPLYLFHFPTLIFSYSVLGSKNAFALVTSSLFVSIFFYHLVDVPIRLKKADDKKLLNC
ncbi:acyltransferase (plasmid) [Nostoc sp. C052]|uniref:acyltransferase family protein n=1 Tax=Nostoc sp. C052 TaxID=2576902 RepID=UPI0015C3A91B|nr:acyltransferase [Nostoc sp. C052]QLE45629.1 acyltransferase [Nostoc sp. C052]